MGIIIHQGGCLLARDTASTLPRLPGAEFRSNLTTKSAYYHQANISGICFVFSPVSSVLVFFSPHYRTLSALLRAATTCRRRVSLQSHRTMTRIKSMSSLRMVLFFLILSVGAAGSAMPYWERWLVTGTTFILGGTTPVRRMSKFAVYCVPAAYRSSLCFLYAAFPFWFLLTTLERLSGGLYTSYFDKVLEGSVTAVHKTNKK